MKVLLQEKNHNVLLIQTAQPDYREKLEAELKELRESELWQAGKTVRSLRPENQVPPDQWKIILPAKDVFRQQTEKIHSVDNSLKGRPWSGPVYRFLMEQSTQQFAGHALRIMIH